LLNKIPEPRTVIVTMQGLTGGTMSVVGLDQPEDRSFAVRLEPDRLRTLKVYVRQPRDRIEGKVQSFTFVVEDKSSFETDNYVASFDAPE
jgi:polyferredoxin